MRIPTLTMFLLNNDVTKHNHEELYKKYVSLYGEMGNLIAMRQVCSVCCDHCLIPTVIQENSIIPIPKVTKKLTSLEDKIAQQDVSSQKKIQTRSNELIQKHRYPGSVGYE